MTRDFRTLCLLVLVLLLASCRAAPTDESAPVVTAASTSSVIETVEAPPTASLPTEEPKATEAASAQPEMLSEATEAVENSSAETQAFPYRLIAYNYTLTDVGDGWEEGVINVAFENTSSEVVNPGFIGLGEAYVETLEGQTYPLKMWEWREDDFPHGRSDTINVLGPVLPGFRFQARSYQRDEKVLRWESAAAATPSRIVFPSNPDLSIDLPEPNSGQGISFEIVEATTEVLDVAEMEGLQLTDSSTSATLALTGNCVYRDGQLYLQVEGINTDQFNSVFLYRDEPWNNLAFSSLDPETGFYTFTDQVFFTDSEFDLQGEIGPGQPFSGFLRADDSDTAFIEDDPGNVIVLWQGDSGLVFSHNCTAELGTGAQPASDEPVYVDATSFPFLFVAGERVLEDDFFRFKNGHVYGATIGGAPQLIPTVATHTVESEFAWSPDNSVVFYDGSAIIKVDLSTGAVTHLSDMQAATLALSADGRNLAFTDGTDLHTLEVETGQTQTIVDGDNTAFPYAPAWSPDGQQIAFFKGGDLAIINADGSGLHVILEEDYGVPGFAPSWSPDGTRLVFSCVLDSWVRLCAINADGSDLQEVVVTQWGDAGVDYQTSSLFESQWGAGGILFINRSPAGEAIYLLAPDSDQVTRITPLDNELDIEWVVYAQ